MIRRPLQRLVSAFESPSIESRQGLVLLAGVSLVGWTLAALLFAGQAYIFSLYRGSPQAWWPTFGYVIAIFSIWALVTPPLVLLVRRVETSGWGLSRRAALYILGLPATILLHVLLFAGLFWPTYNNDGRLPTRWAMAERMLLSNLDKNLLLYAGLVGGVVAVIAYRRRHQGWQIDRARLAASVNAPRPSLRVRSGGTQRAIALDRIIWIEAAGNYSEVHTAGGSHLIDESLSALERLLPPDAFARVHRRAIVHFDRIQQVRGIGRGDALIALDDGTQLRLSRRFRDRLKPWLSAEKA